jgi:hypothetical protein
MPVVADASLGGELFFSRGFQTLSGTETFERVPLVQQDLRVFRVDGAAFTLSVRTKRPTHVGPLVPGESEPTQRLQYCFLAGFSASDAVRVFDAQNELAAVLARKTQVEQSHVSGADVRVTRG